MTIRPLRTIFRLEQHQTTISREVIAGLTTFTTIDDYFFLNSRELGRTNLNREVWSRLFHRKRKNWQDRQ
jgi:xanthine/uracil/vitamin C permease (AzgA family)